MSWKDIFKGTNEHIEKGMDRLHTIQIDTYDSLGKLKRSIDSYMTTYKFFLNMTLFFYVFCGIMIILNLMFTSRWISKEEKLIGTLKEDIKCIQDELVSQREKSWDKFKYMGCPPCNDYMTDKEKEFLEIPTEETEEANDSMQEI